MKTLYLKLLFYLTHKRIPKKQDGRCITCDGNKICNKIQLCKCNDNEQYQNIFR